MISTMVLIMIRITYCWRELPTTVAILVSTLTPAQHNIQVFNVETIIHHLLQAETLLLCFPSAKCVSIMADQQ